MAQPLTEWHAQEVAPHRDKPIAWLTGHHFHRDEPRAVTVDNGCFLTPADGVILYQRTVDPTDPILDVKGRPYSLVDITHQPRPWRPCLVVGIFMTWYDCHVNRVPYSGYMTSRERPPLRTLNRPMLAAENTILDDLRLPDADSLDYLHTNQRVVSTVRCPALGVRYHLAQIADADADQVVTFHHKPNTPYNQGDRFGMIRHGSQCELVIPCDRLTLRPIHPDGWHVKAGVDALVAIEE